MLHIVFDVVARNIIGLTAPGTTELSGHWWMPLLIFLGLSHAEARDEHIKTTLLARFMSPQGAKIANLANSGFALLAACLLAIGAGDATVRAIALNLALFGGITLPLWPIKVIVLLSTLAFAWAIFTTLTRDLRTSWAGQHDAENDEPFSLEGTTHV
ncbi:TRAP transporter small permease subunit [Citricoccus parietis]